MFMFIDSFKSHSIFILLVHYNLSKHYFIEIQK